MILSWPFIIALTVASLLLIGLGLAALAMRRRNVHLWLPNYVCSSRPDPLAESRDEPIDVFIAVCDHFEPELGNPGRSQALERVRRWHAEYPRRFARFADSRGRSPQHTFFFPADQYAPEYIDPLADLCAAGHGDVDVHLHHDGDTAARLRETLESFRDVLHHRHGLLRRNSESGEVVYGFIHGDWALCNSRSDGSACGVDHELRVLLETGCYADFTMPSAPDETQTSTINSIYYAADTRRGRKCHDIGTGARVGSPPPADSLLMIQGPLVIDWLDRKWGLAPRVDNGDLHAGRPPSWSRFRNWLRAGVTVAGRPDWRFVKLHTHGARPGNIDLWLGNGATSFHEDLARQARTGGGFRYYYVTAWEMAQLVHQAERGLKKPDFEALHSTEHMLT